MQDVSSEHSDMNMVFLDNLSLKNESSWTINVMVKGERVKFNIVTTVKGGGQLRHNCQHLQIIPKKLTTQSAAEEEEKVESPEEASEKVIKHRKEEMF